MATGSGLRQVVYLSNRPQVLAETLSYVEHFMPWLDQAVVVTPDPEAVAKAAAGCALELVVLRDSDVLGPGEQIPDAHSARNAFLRRSLARRGPLDDVFLQSDDDYRPLKPIGPEQFVEDGRLHSYAFHDLALWRHGTTTFDSAQHATYLAMSYLGGEHLAYGSHQPQAIDRQLYVDAFDAADRLSTTTAFCDWALPLNHGRLVAPERFHHPRTFRTLGWPQHPHEWPFWRRPEDLSFENFYPELYQTGHLFDGISTALDTAEPERQAFEKISRWYAFDLAAGSLSFPPGVVNPWQTSARRRLAFRVLRWGRKAHSYLALEERERLAELAGQLDRLERRP